MPLQHVSSDSVVPPVKLQKQITDELSDTKRVEGTCGFIVNKPWYDTFLEYINEKRTVPPTAINNAQLLDEDGRLKSTYLLGYEFVVVNKAQWDYLKEWYGVETESDEMLCPYMKDNFDDGLVPDPRARKVAVSKSGEGAAQDIWVKADATVADLRRAIAKTMGIDGHRLDELSYENACTGTVKLDRLTQELYSLEDLDMGKFVFTLKPAALVPHRRNTAGDDDDDAELTDPPEKSKNPQQFPPSYIGVGNGAVNNDSDWFNSQNSNGSSGNNSGHHNGNGSGHYSSSQQSGSTYNYGTNHSGTTYGRTTGNGAVSGGGASGGGGSGGYTYTSYYDDTVRDTPPGRAGLNNLGNTCFMNSALQCLSNTAPLVQYFVSGDFLPNLNRTNPLGNKGELAEAFAALMRKLWSGRFCRVRPTQFKAAISQFAPQFSGYRQHDSQELIAFLLDGLHEDVNKVQIKQYRETPDCVNPTEEAKLAAAALAWNYHKERNDSKVVDLFLGQFMSTVVCPDCHNPSLKFDPLMYLSLPLPVPTTTDVHVLMFWEALSRMPTKYVMQVRKSATFGSIAKDISRLTGVPVANLVVRKPGYQAGKLDAYQIESDPIEDGYSSKAPSVYAYEVASETPDEQLVQITFFHLKKSSIYSDVVGLPLVAKIPAAHMTYDDLYGYLLDRLDVEHLFRPTSDDDDVDTNDSESTIAYDTNVAMSNKVPGHALDDLPDDLPAKIPATSPAAATATAAAADDDDGAPPADAVAAIVLAPRPFVIRGADRYYSLPSSYSSYGCSTVRDDGQPLTLKNGDFVALEWSPEAWAKAEKIIFDIMVDSSAKSKPHDDEEAPSSKRCNLMDCIKLFTQPETLAEDEMWKCKICDDFKQAQKTLELWKLPDYLVVHLKRFQQRGSSRVKIEMPVDFPLEGLDLSPFVVGPDRGQEHIYDLYAVSVR
eukprot:TRINITY_DN3117_c0_g1_i1.p1 TRINITY_DN3117_c0_g1~~TRINITY_DN3117_c0_g1_i1.p1  ORF type:complete len:938 (+),score=163.09 TRINITY_DN3117_c0_g1_i1:63-2876(+)